MSVGANRLYFDIETYNPNNPFFAGKVITIAYKNSETETKVLKEWNSDETSILRDFFQYVREQLKTQIRTELVGFNILRFDIPFLVNRGVQNRIDSAENLLDLFHNTFTIDLMYCLLTCNDFRFAGIGAYDVAQKLGLPCPQLRGKDILRLYENKEYLKIEEHIREDIVFTECLDAELRKRISNIGAHRFWTPLTRDNY